MAICRVYWSTVIWIDETDNTFDKSGDDMTPEQVAIAAADVARESLLDGSMSGFTVIADDKYGFLIDLEARDGSGGVPHAVNSWLEEETNNV